MGSTPFSARYFSIKRFSNMEPDTGDTTGCSGTSLETKNKITYLFISNNEKYSRLCSTLAGINHKLYCKNDQFISIIII